MARGHKEGLREMNVRSHGDGFSGAHKGQNLSKLYTLNMYN